MFSQLVLFQKYFEFFPLKKIDVLKLILLGPFDDCLIWTPSQTPLRHKVKLLQQLTMVNKDLVQFQMQVPILMRQEYYGMLWVM